MPPGTTKLVYEVLEAGVKPLAGLAVPVVPPCPAPLAQAKEALKPPPPRPPPQDISAPEPQPTPQDDSRAHASSWLHDAPHSPFDLHGSIFDVGRDARSEGTVARSMHSGGAWLRALSKMEVLMAVGGYFGSLNTVQAVRLSATQPILPQDVRAALMLVARRTELLQACVSWRWAWPWFRRRSHITAPFRVAREPLMEAYYRTLEAPYDMSRGPLWRACLVPEGRGVGGEHRAVLVLAVHHCLNDAYTNTVLCREVLEVLNAALQGQRHLPPIRPLAPPLADQLLGPRELLAALAFTVYKFLTPTLGRFNRKVYFKGAVPRPSARHARTARTRVLHAELTEEATTQLRRRCREAGVTVHALVSAATQVAILQTAGAFGRAAPDEALVRVFNCVNLRRYFREEDREALGCFISIEEEEGRVTLQDSASGDALWALARRGHTALKASLEEERRPLCTLAAFIPVSLLIPVNCLLTRLGLLNLNDNHVITTNMGDMRPLLHPGPGPVSPTHLLRCVSDAYTGHPYTLVLHTFAGRFSLALEYYSTKTTPAVARAFFTALTNLMLDLAATGAPAPHGGPHRAAALHHDKFCPEADDPDHDPDLDHHHHHHKAH
ncbi:uncharacterized protein LOC123509084 [Portunus trituberculatus]|uniref:uncharacterized protein LOC123509084 n=1 Tax=Portunus trituberculatus TaxID=210409 RepID=UPI001E1CE1F9|nr:uncharacterized protein LOC123509084 [Portunus trituberculatus]